MGDHSPAEVIMGGLEDIDIRDGDENTQEESEESKFDTESSSSETENHGDEAHLSPSNTFTRVMYMMCPETWMDDPRIRRSMWVFMALCFLYYFIVDTWEKTQSIHT